jgi:LDH2 family malate/lactate/ureidoglycolate dehydrogenase
MTSQILSLPQIGDITRRAFSACGASGQQLELAVESVVDAECDGIRTVGLNFLPIYCSHLQVGKLKGDAAPIFENNTGGEPRIGQFFIAISPATFSLQGAEDFSQRLEAMLNALAHEPGVRLPGIRRDEFRQEAEQNGVEVPQELINRLEAFAAGRG